MPPSEPLRVFISYARKDGAALGQRLQADLTKNGLDVWLDTQRIRSSAVWSKEIEQEIDTRQVTIALLTPGSYASEICRAEQLRALDKGNRLLPVLACKGADRPLYLYARQYRDFSDDGNYDDGNYDVSLGELIADIRGGTSAMLPETFRKTRVTYLTAPPRVANYLERPEALHALRDALFAEDHRQPIALTALAGMGGIGKTVLAKALTDDEVVQRAFPDGIVWITAGKQRKRDFIAEMREVAKALGDDLSGYDTALACENQYRTTIAGKAALIVVDDVWSKSDIQPLLAESPRSRFLFTTRDAAIGRFVCAHEHRADLLDVAQSRELLASWADMAVAKLPAAADVVISECGRLPLALSVVGAMLRGESAEFWADTVDLLRKADLSAIQEQLPEGQQSFFKAVEVSFQSLTPRMQERYKALAVLLDDMAVPLAILQTLWNVNEAEARRISHILVDRSLAQREDGEESIRLHDLQLDYVRTQYSDKEALALIHGAVRLSANVTETDPAQFASQLVGRLLPHKNISAIELLADRLVEGTGTTWLRPLKASLRPAEGPLVRTIRTMGGEIQSLAYSDGAALIASGDAEGAVRLWDFTNGQEVGDLRGHVDAVTSLRFTADSKLLVSAGRDKTVRIWDIAKRACWGVLPKQKKRINALALFPSGRVVTAADEKGLRTWDIHNQSELTFLEQADVKGVCVASTADGARLCCGGSNGYVRVWDFASGRLLSSWRAHRSAIYEIAVTKDGRRVVTAAGEENIRVWDAETGVLRSTLAPGSLSLSSAILKYHTALLVMPDDAHIASGIMGGNLTIWRLDPPEELSTILAHVGGVNALVTAQKGDYLLSASGDRTIRIWNYEKLVKARQTFAREDGIKRVKVLSDGRVLTSTNAGWIAIWEIETGKKLQEWPAHPSWISALDVNPDMQVVISGSTDALIKLWDLNSGSLLKTIRGHESSVLRTVFSPDGRYALSTSYDKSNRIWDVNGGFEVGRLEVDGEVSDLIVTADGNWVIGLLRAGTGKCSFAVWDFRTRRLARRFGSQGRDVFRLVADSAGKRGLTFGFQDRVLAIWDLHAGHVVGELTGHTLSVWDAELTHDGKRAISVAHDHSVRVWDVESQEALATFTAEGPVHSCSIGSDSRTIVAGDCVGNLYFLRLEFPTRQ